MNNEANGLLTGKKGVVLGVANHRSLAWAIAKEAELNGAQVAVTYYNERLKDNAEELVSELGNGRAYPCDLTNDDEIKNLRKSLEKDFGTIDFVAHCVAFAKKEELAGRFIDSSREGFQIAMDSSVYTFVGAAKFLEPILSENASLLTLSYLGSERAVMHYNVMGVAKAALEASVRYLAADLGPKGIRVNALSPGPINTLAARGITGFNTILQTVEERAPLHRNIEQDDVAKAAVFFFSDASKNITGEILYIDSGYHIVGL